MPFNLIKRNWKSDPTCYFCDKEEYTSYLFFSCPIAKVIWIVVATCIKASNIPKHLNQCWKWCEFWLPSGKRKYHVLGVAAIGWAIWRTEIKLVLRENKKNSLETLQEIICHACTLMQYWTGLYAEMYNGEAHWRCQHTMLCVAEEILTSQLKGDGVKQLKKDV